MPSEKKYSIWPALLIIFIAFGLPIAIGTIEVRIARNAHAENAALLQLQAIAKAEDDYRKSNHSFSANLNDLKDLPKSDGFYQYGYHQVSPDRYFAMAWPKEPGKHGKRYFFMDQTGVVRYEILRPASPTSNEVPLVEKK